MSPTLQRIAGGGLRITALEIRNLWGIAEAVIRPGQRNIIRGANGTGKSSLLNAVQLALGGGTLGKYQRLGSEETPQIVLEISGPNDFVRVEREGDKPPKVLRRVGESEAFEKVPQPATFLKSLFDVRGANPFSFLLASDDDRAQLLLEALELEMDEPALAELLGPDAELAKSVPEKLHPLVRLSLIHDAIYSARRGCNVEAEGKRKAAEQLKRSVPAQKIEDLSAAIAELEGTHAEKAGVLGAREEAAEQTAARAIREAALARDREQEKLESDWQAGKAKLVAEHDSWAAELRAETERKISVRRDVLDETLEKSRRALANLWTETAAAHEKLIEAATAKLDEDRRAVAAEQEALRSSRDELARLRERQEERARHENTRKAIRSFESAAEWHEADSDRLTSILRGLEELKRKLASRLPIEGLEISGKEILVNGVPWSQLNAGQQGTIAGIVAVERAKKSRLPVLFFDEAERFDQAHLDAIAKVVEDAGAQLFAAVVAREGEISVEADGELVGAVEMGAPEDPTA